MNVLMAGYVFPIFFWISVVVFFRRRTTSWLSGILHEFNKTIFVTCAWIFFRILTKIEVNYCWKSFYIVLFTRFFFNCAINSYKCYFRIIFKYFGCLDVMRLGIFAVSTNCKKKILRFLDWKFISIKIFLPPWSIKKSVIYLKYEKNIKMNFKK